jgi:succinate-acetate transporter protein
MFFVYKEQIMTFNFKDINFLVIFGLAIFTVLLFIGGFSKNSSLTIISGILIMLFAILLIIIDMKEVMSIVTGSVFFSIGFLFVTTGNRKANLSR